MKILSWKKPSSVVFILVLSALFFCLILPRRAQAAYDFGSLGESVNLGLGEEIDDENLAKFSGGDFLESITVGIAALLLGDDWDSNEVPYVPQANRRQGLMAAAGSMVDRVYLNPPNLQTALFFRRMWARNIVTGPAYAETGADYLRPIIEMELWTKIRNICYVLMVIVLVVMGFMIMLRAKIDPRTTMTVTNALPSIAVALILITFSYPIAGLLLDFGNVVKGLIDGVFGDIVQTGGVGLGTALRTAINFLTSGLNVDLGGVGVISGAVSQLLKAGLAIMCFVIFIRLFWTLLTRWVGIFIQVIFAPLVFLAGAIPGRTGVITGWFKGVLVNVLSFPAIYFLINLALYISQPTAPAFPMPEDLGMYPEVWFKPGTSSDLGALVAFGILIMATKVPEALESAFETVAPAHVARAGMDVGAVVKKLPIIGKAAGGR